MGKKGQANYLGANRVSVQTDTWTAQFIDEMGKVRRVSTKTVHRSIAEKILAQYEKEVDRIKTGIITREELGRAQIKQTPLNDLLGQFRTKMIAEGTTAKHINDVMRRITIIFQDCDIDSIAKIRREAIERWIAQEIKSKVRSAGTINTYINSVKAFAQYITDIDVFVSHPLKSIRKLNEDVDRRKHRRAMTQEEVDRLLTATATGTDKNVGRSDERVLIYRLLLGTGLMRHSTPLLTAKLYIDVDPINMKEALEQMPGFSPSVPTSPKIVSPNDSV